MINVPLPTRIAIGTIIVNGKQLEVYLSTEWARYFESMNNQSNSTLQNLNNFSTGAFSGLLADGGDGSDSSLPPPGPRGLPGDTGATGPALILGDEAGSVEFIPGPPGRDGDPGRPGPAIFMLQDDPSGDDVIPFALNLAQKADVSGAAFTGPVSAVGDYPTAHAVSAKSTAASNAAMSAAANSDLTHFLVNYSGSTADPSPTIFWKTGVALRFGVATNAVSAASFTQLAALSSTGLALNTGFGCNSKTPQAAVPVAAAATDLATAINLCNQLRAALIANGIAE